MKLIITINTEEDAFHDDIDHHYDPNPELARILGKLLDMVETLPRTFMTKGSVYYLRDSNGNTVGKAEVKP